MKTYTIEEAKKLFNLDIVKEGIYEIRYYWYTTTGISLTEPIINTFEINVIDNSEYFEHGNAD